MADKSAIEWTDATWNPLYGCSDASEGCRNCYAKTLAHIRQSNPNPKIAERFKGLTRLNAAGKVCWTGQINLAEDQLLVPTRWKRPRRIFVNSQSDLFHPSVPFSYVDKVFAVIALCSGHIFQVLTKRPERMAEYLNEPERRNWIAKAIADIPGHFQRKDGLYEYCNDLTDSRFAYEGKWPLPNVWLMTSVENQETADLRIPHLRNCPAAVRGLSCEPLIGDVRFYDECFICQRCGSFLAHLGIEEDDCPQCPKCGCQWYTFGIPADKASFYVEGEEDPAIHWVIVGGESGPNARPMNPNWARSIRDQCNAAGVAFFFKQAGEWDCYEHAGQHLWQSPYTGVQKDASWFPDFDALPDRARARWDTDIEETLIFEKVGKKRAGRVLDGRTWDEFPEVSQC